MAPGFLSSRISTQTQNSPAFVDSTNTIQTDLDKVWYTFGRLAAYENISDIVEDTGLFPGNEEEGKGFSRAARQSRVEGLCRERINEKEVFFTSSCDSSKDSY